VTPHRALRLALRGLHLPRDERLVALHALALLLRAAGSLRARGLARTEARLRAPVVRASLDPARVAALVDIVASVVPGATCLARSLALTRLLHERAVLCIGVRPGERELDAHAWVELDGVVLNDVADVRERYAVIETRSAQQP
jgi:Transglutaminase-like superfamily